MKKQFNYKKFLYLQGYGTKKSSNVELKFTSPLSKWYKNIIDKAKNNDISFFQELCKKTILFDKKNNDK